MKETEWKLVLKCKYLLYNIYFHQAYHYEHLTSFVLVSFLLPKQLCNCVALCIPLASNQYSEVWATLAQLDQITQIGLRLESMNTVTDLPLFLPMITFDSYWPRQMLWSSFLDFIVKIISRFAILHFPATYIIYHTYEQKPWWDHLRPFTSHNVMPGRFIYRKYNLVPMSINT